MGHLLRWTALARFVFGILPCGDTRSWLYIFKGEFYRRLDKVAILLTRKLYQVTTDPVELWASPTSRSRVEKEFFDSHFDPFYRNEQIIIRARNLSSILHPTSVGNITFGPAFNDTFLKEVLNLQEQIKALGNGTEYSFDKICFAPLRNEGDETTLDQCVIQSVWGYFQNDVDLFDTTDIDPLGFETNYLDAILMCTS